MREIISIIISFFVCLFNGVEMQQPQHTEYNNSFYSPSAGTVDYKKAYALHSAAQTDVTEQCNPTLRNPTSMKPYTPNESTAYYWFVNNETPNDNYDLYTVEESTPDNLRYEIIAPNRCTLLTSSSSCNNGDRMVIQTGDYEITFNGLECWYCCSHKTPPANGLYTHTGENLKGTVFSKGNLIAIGNKETTVSITKNGSSVSLQEFYEGNS